MGILARLWKKVVLVLSIPVVLSEFFRTETGEQYSVGFRQKIILIFRMAANVKKVTTASHFLEHLIMGTQILKLPPSLEGCVVECGTFKGGSAANLSLICRLCHRQLEIFDSFDGLPVPTGADSRHLLVMSSEIHEYSEGAYRGTLSEVKKNVSRCGSIDVCIFNPGYFADTLPNFRRKSVLVFLDVDLIESLKTCLSHLWPQLENGCCLFTHEANHMEVSSLFFDRSWWTSNCGCEAPGLIGAGTGLGLLPASGGFCSAIGYVVKNPLTSSFVINEQNGPRVAKEAPDSRVNG